MKERISTAFLVVFLFFVTFEVNALSKKFATYEELIYPEFLGDLKYINVQAKAGQEVVFRFVKKKRTLATHPHKAMLAMAWLEILYNEMVKNPKGTRDETVESIYNIRNQLRKSIGMEDTSSAQECINRFVLLSKILSYGKLETSELSAGVQKRKQLISTIKGSLGNMKSKYEENLIDAKAVEVVDEVKIDSSKETLSDFTDKIRVESNEKIRVKFNKDNPDYTKKLEELKKLYEDNLINKEEYEETRKRILDENF